MSPQRHREVNAKVEGRDPPRPVKQTMTPFRTLIGRLLKVTPDEVAEQQRLYEAARQERFNAAAPSSKGKNKRLVAASSAILLDGIPHSRE